MATHPPFSPMYAIFGRRRGNCNYDKREMPRGLEVGRVFVWIGIQKGKRAKQQAQSTQQQSIFPRNNNLFPRNNNNHLRETTSAKNLRQQARNTKDSKRSVAMFISYWLGRIQGARLRKACSNCPDYPIYPLYAPRFCPPST